MLGWELPPFNSGGLGEACFGLTKSLSQKGVDITFVLPFKVDVKVPFMKVVFADLNEEISSFPSVYLTDIPKYLRKLTRDSLPPDYIQASFKFASRIPKVLKSLGLHPDLIHAHDWLTYPAAIVAKQILGKPLIAHVHSTEFDRTGGHSPNPFVYQIEKEAFMAADVVVPVGGLMRTTLIKNYDVRPEKIRVVHNGIEDVEKASLPPVLSAFKKMGYKIVLFLGRITLQKGPEYFVRAAKKVLEYNSKTIFVVTGTGDMYEFMVNEATRLGILDKFIFTGFLRGEEKDRVFQSADLYVMPSVSEPFGITALEAVSNGVPVLVSKQSGVSEVLKNTLKVDFWDIEEMANKILAVLEYDALPKDLKKESTKEIKLLTWSRSADKMLEIYSQVLQ